MNFLKRLYEDANNIKEKDPAARNLLEVIILYQGFHALFFYRIAHYLYNHKLYFISRLISQVARFLTGIEIHPRCNNRKKTIYRPWNGNCYRRNCYHWR